MKTLMNIQSIKAKKEKIINYLLIATLVIGAISSKPFLPMFMAGVFFAFIALTDEIKYIELDNGQKLSPGKIEYIIHYFLVITCSIISCGSFYLAFTSLK